jgi:alkanesulfonate monooxygenase SsuD/methylene tetrahydromethanopterin reductase-like flavin-dependent oxidoreductase (luciferase family)
VPTAASAAASRVGGPRLYSRRVVRGGRSERDRATRPAARLAPIRSGVVGTHDEIVEQLREWADAGVQRAIFQIVLLDDVESIDLIGEQLSRRLAAAARSPRPARLQRPERDEVTFAIAASARVRR